MNSLTKAGLAGFFIAWLFILSACSGGNTSNNSDGNNVNPQTEGSSSGGTTASSTGESGTTSAESDTGSSTDSGNTSSTDGSTDNADMGTDEGSTDSGTGTSDSTGETSSDTGTSDATGETDSGTTGSDTSGSDNDVPNSGVDLSGGDDDSPTPTETASLQGPFVRDESRSAGPPSSPAGLTLLLGGENWAEFTWTPSADDQSVEAYEVYRDGTLVFTVRGDTGYEFDYRYWLSTSYMDCNYTRYPGCRDTQPASSGSYEYTVVAVDNEGMRSAPSAPAVFELVSSHSGGADLSGYSEIFNEEFDGDNLDRNLWKTSLPWGPDRTINAEMQYFVNIFGNNPPNYNPFVFTGNTLQITGVATPPELVSEANNQPYLSGVITTADYFEMTYGYVEMNARVAGGEGLLSTFYLFNQNFDDNKPEIDIIEYVGSRPDKAYQTYHYFDSNRSRYASGENHSSPTMETNVGENLSAGYHTYGVLWEPGLMVWYIDGAEVRRLVGPRVSDEPMNIIAHLVIGSEWIGSPSASSLPAIFEIDYIRAWQKN